jgi:uncharacterized protein (TIGR02246 family)
MFRSIFGWIFVLVLGAGMPCSAIAAGNGAGQHDGIEAGAQALMDAVARRDAAAIAATYTPDAQMLPANSDTISGRQAIRTLWQTWIDEDLGGLKLVPIEIRVFGNDGYDISFYELTDGSGRVTDYGKSLVVWKKLNGKWYLHRDIWTTSVPLAAP